MYLFSLVADQNDILNTAIQSQEAVATAMNVIWEDIVTNDGIYGAVASIGGLFASITLGFSLVQIIKELIGDDKSFIPYERFIWWAMVILLLVNKGENLARLTISGRDLIRSTNQSVLEQAVAGKTLEEHFQEATRGIGEAVATEENIQLCSQITDSAERQICLDNLQVSAEGSGFNVLDFLPEVPNVGEMITSNIEKFFILVMLALSVAFQWLVEVTLILTALIGPIAVGLSLLPVTQKAVYTWLIGFYSVGLTQLCYNIIIGLLAVLQSSAPSTNKLIFTVSIGLLAPVLSIILASGAGLATFSSLAGLAGVVGAKVGGATAGVSRKVGQAGWNKATSRFRRRKPSVARR